MRRTVNRTVNRIVREKAINDLPLASEVVAADMRLAVRASPLGEWLSGPWVAADDEADPLPLRPDGSAVDTWRGIPV
jgi:hypothetical protein